MGISQSRGKAGEESVYNLLSRYFGNNIQKCGYFDPCDFIIFGKTVELKTARPRHLCGKGTIPGWKFNLHRHGKNPVNPDFYILRLEAIPYMGKKAIHLLFDGNQNRKTIAITLRSLMNGDFEKAKRFKMFCKRKGEFSLQLRGKK